VRVKRGTPTRPVASGSVCAADDCVERALWCFSYGKPKNDGVRSGQAAGAVLASSTLRVRVLAKRRTEYRILTGPEKARENRLRRLAERQAGMVLTRSRRRDPRVWDYGRYRLARRVHTDEDDLGPIEFGSLDEVENYLLQAKGVSAWPATGGGASAGQAAGRHRPSYDERVERMAQNEGFIVEHRSSKARYPTIWLNSEKDRRTVGPFYNDDAVEKYLRTPPDQRPSGTQSLVVVCRPYVLPP